MNIYDRQDIADPVSSTSSTQSSQSLSSSTTTSAGPPNVSGANHSGKLKAGAIAGIAIGCLALVGILLVIFICFRLRRSRTGSATRPKRRTGNRQEPKLDLNHQPDFAPPQPFAVHESASETNFTSTVPTDPSSRGGGFGTRSDNYK